MSYENKIKELKINLPKAADPVGSYVASKISGKLLFISGQISIDENTIICNNYNKEVFEYFKKHKVEPIVYNFRHRYFWDGGVHCITQDLYREGKMENYFE